MFVDFVSILVEIIVPLTSHVAYYNGLLSDKCPAYGVFISVTHKPRLCIALHVEYSMTSLSNADNFLSNLASLNTGQWRI